MLQMRKVFGLVPVDINFGSVFVVEYDRLSIPTNKQTWPLNIIAKSRWSVLTPPIKPNMVRPQSV